jgi:hypothetical protein
MYIVENAEVIVTRLQNIVIRAINVFKNSIITAYG